VRSAVVGLILLVGCHHDAPEKPLSDATSLACPFPGDLPFRLASSGFAQAANADLVVDDPRSKDESSDTIGNPNGIVASIYLDDTAMATDTTVDYHGAKARTTPDLGLRQTFSARRARQSVDVRHDRRVADDRTRRYRLHRPLRSARYRLRRAERPADLLDARSRR